MRLKVRILTPDSIFQDEKAEELILQTRTGKVGILKDHAPLISALDIGPMMFRQESKWTTLALIGGFALVKENQVTILVNEAVAADSVEKREVEKDLEKAENRLNQAVEEKEKIEATFAYKRARARYQIVQWKGLLFIDFLIEKFLLVRK